MFPRIPHSPLLRFMLLPVSWCYGTIVTIRNWCYDWGFFKTYRMARPVIAIGNITVGGTGKTPMTLAIAELLHTKGYKVGIVSRGYKRRSREEIVVSDGRGNLQPADIAGDEPRLMAEKLPQAVVIVANDRVRAAQMAIEKFGCEVILADDAFQHRRLGATLNIVLWDRYLSPRRQHLLPAGRLREPYRGLKRADWLIFTKTEHYSITRAGFFKRYNPHLLITAAPVRIVNLRLSKDNRSLPPSFITQQRVLSFCGLGNQRQFFESIDKLNPKLQIEIEFPDHYRYTPADLAEIQAKAREHGCDYLITTEKDFVNLPPAAQSLENLIVVVIKIELETLLAQNILSVVNPR